MAKITKINKLKVVVSFSVYNKDHKQSQNDNDSIYYCSLNDEDKSNPLFIKFNTGDVLEVREILVCHNLKSYAYIVFNNRTYEVPVEVLNFCTEKL